MAGTGLAAPCSSGSRSIRSVLLSFPPCSSGLTWPTIRRGNSKLSFSTLSDGRRKEDPNSKMYSKTKVNLKKE